MKGQREAHGTAWRSRSPSGASALALTARRFCGDGCRPMATRPAGRPRARTRSGTRCPSHVLAPRHGVWQSAPCSPGGRGGHAAGTGARRSGRWLCQAGSWRPAGQQGPGWARVIDAVGWPQAAGGAGSGQAQGPGATGKTPLCGPASWWPSFNKSARAAGVAWESPQAACLPVRWSSSGVSLRLRATRSPLRTGRFVFSYFHPELLVSTTD